MYYGCSQIKAKNFIAWSGWRPKTHPSAEITAKNKELKEGWISHSSFFAKDKNISVKSRVNNIA